MSCLRIISSRVIVSGHKSSHWVLDACLHVLGHTCSCCSHRHTYSFYCWICNLIRQRCFRTKAAGFGCGKSILHAVAYSELWIQKSWLIIFSVIPHPYYAIDYKLGYMRISQAQRENISHCLDQQWPKVVWWFPDCYRSLCPGDMLIHMYAFYLLHTPIQNTCRLGLISISDVCVASGGQLAAGNLVPEFPSGSICRLSKRRWIDTDVHNWPYRNAHGLEVEYGSPHWVWPCSPWLAVSVTLQFEAYQELPGFVGHKYTLPGYAAIRSWYRAISTKAEPDPWLWCVSSSFCLPWGTGVYFPRVTVSALLWLLGHQPNSINAICSFFSFFF